METRTVFTMAELDPLDAPENDPLVNFTCHVGACYPVSQEWCFPDEHPRAGLLDVRRALNNLEAFIEDVRRHRHVTYPHGPQVNVADLQVPLEPGGSREEKLLS